MVPLLRAVADGETHRTSELLPRLADEFGLSEEERSTLVPSGRATVLYSRVQWARTYMYQAGLLTSPKRGYIRLSDEGRQVISTNPKRIDLAFLRKYPAFVDFESRTKAPPVPGAIALDGSSGPTIGGTAETPDETLERTWRELRTQVAVEVLEKVRSASPRFFEELVVRLLVAMGYGGSYADAASVVGKSGDEGIDGIIKEDRLGLDALYVQAKRWQSVVGRPVIQAFAGSLEGARARKGVMITTSSFTPDAKSYVNQIEKRIVLIDGPTLAELMIEHCVGIATDRTYVVPRIDLDFFEEG
ncbi:MAG: restriction endonuclease [Candidatus Dormibacteraeota bacterium]|uniref:Restriction endonuclease n=2 Tax=Candidatus Aeolococcus gillhamiae TaxID=3127015 RepID=A0A2W5Z3A3_9BACT|nr:restriction endonuclease [Candidatus Dormibacteraeota bacterium]PZR79722.1 MAG: restriction endonuclease [Candidatus Dormibacter sp. RRmetagenome_bin12]